MLAWLTVCGLNTVGVSVQPYESCRWFEEVTEFVWWCEFFNPLVTPFSKITYIDIQFLVWRLLFASTISFKFVPNGTINNKPALAKIMALTITWSSGSLVCGRIYTLLCHDQLNMNDYNVVITRIHISTTVLHILGPYTDFNEWNWRCSRPEYAHEFINRVVLSTS